MGPVALNEGGTMSTRRRMAVTLSVLVLLLAGCGGGGGGSAESEPPDGTAAAPTEDGSQAPADTETAAPSDDAATDDPPSDAATAAAGMTVGPMCDHVDEAILEEVFGSPPKVRHEAEPGDVLPKKLSPPGAKDFKATAYICFYASAKGGNDIVYLSLREADEESYKASLKNAKNNEFTQCKMEEDVLFGPQSYIERCSAGGEEFVRHTAVIGTAAFGCVVGPPDAKDAEAVEALAADLCGGVVEAMSS